jgi:hypothetical protein
MLNKHTSLHEFTIIANPVLAGGISNGDYYPIEFEWNADPANFGGTRLTTRLGTKNSTSYATLSTVSDIVNASSPYITTLGEGLIHRRLTHASGTCTIIFDNTDTYRG